MLYPQNLAVEPEAFTLLEISHVVHCLSLTPRNRLSMRSLTHCGTAMQSKLVRKAQAGGGGQRSHACRAACTPPRFAGTPTFLPRKIDASNMRAGRQAVQATACLRGRLHAGSKRSFFRGRGCRVSQQPAHRESGHGCNGRPPGGGSRCDDLGESLRRCSAPRGHGAVQQLRKALHAACAAPQARNSAHRTDGPAGGGVAQARYYSAPFGSVSRDALSDGPAADGDAAAVLSARPSRGVQRAAARGRPGSGAAPCGCSGDSATWRSREGAPPVGALRCEAACPCGYKNAR